MLGVFTTLPLLLYVKLYLTGLRICDSETAGSISGYCRFVASRRSGLCHGVLAVIDRYALAVILVQFRKLRFPVVTRIQSNAFHSLAVLVLQRRSDRCMLRVFTAPPLLLDFELNLALLCVCNYESTGSVSGYF